MADVAIDLLGPFLVRRNGEPVSLGSRRTEALFAYLVQTGTVHRREHLAELLWGVDSAAKASGNLRVLLTNLRKSVGDVVEISRSTAAFLPPLAGVQVDTAAFLRRTGEVIGRPAEQLDDEEVRALQDALRLCRGDFLEGFDLADSERFDDWVRRERSLLEAHRVSVLVHLTEALLARSETPSALRHATQLLDIRPLEERSHQLVIRALLQAGDVDGATRQFEWLEATLHEELGTVPSAETRLLFAVPPGQARRRAAGRAPSRGAAPISPGPSSGPTTRQPWSAFAGRTRELSALLAHGTEARAGRGRVVFVLGGIGSGKTMLVRRAVRQLLGGDPATVALGASCVDAAGSGDPAILAAGLAAQLSGDARGPWLEGPMPALVAERISGAGHPGGGLAGASAPSLVGVLHSLRERAAERPVLLVLENLQWAAPATLNLVAEIAKDIRRHPVLVLATARPESAQPARRSALSWLVTHLCRVAGAATVDLELDEHRAAAFTRELVAAERTDLPPSVATALVQLAEGNPLLTVELLREQVRRGRLKRHEDRLETVEEPVWRCVPERVALAFEERLGAVEQDLWPVLAAAAATGGTFSVHEVARRCGRDPRRLVEQLAGPLGRELGLFRAVPGGSAYRFTPPLLQVHLEGRLDDAQRLVLGAPAG